MQAKQASILWTTQTPGKGAVIVTGPDGNATTWPATMQTFSPASTDMASAYYQYRANITGLEPGTLYSYQVSSNGQPVSAGSGASRFRTAAQTSFSFLAFGDSGAVSEEQQSLVQLMAAETNVSLVLHLGDLAYSDGTFAELEQAYYAENAILMSRLPFFSTPGNHDYNTDSAAPYLAGFAPPESGVPAADIGRYYSFDWGNAHFTSLDTNLLGSARAQAMLDWLDADLAATTKHWRIVFFHHPPYPTGFHRGDPLCHAARQYINPIVEKHGVQLVLSGHEHGYERTYPLAGGNQVNPPTPSTMYVISGGGGGVLESVGSLPQCAISVQAFHYLRVDIRGEALTFTAIGLDGKEIERVSLGSQTPARISRVASKGDYGRAVAPGSLITVLGANLALENAVSPAGTVAAELSGVSLKVDGKNAGLVSVSSTEIEAQMPFGISGPVTLELSTPTGFASAQVIVSPTAPSLIEIVTPHGVFSSSNPASPGSGLSLYVTGLGELASDTGPVTPFEGQRAAAPVEVRLGRLRLQPSFAGAAPGAPGLYRVDVAVPAGLPDGIYALRVIAAGVSSRPANLDVITRGSADQNRRALARVSN